jgi:hypothetical protein
VITNLTAIMDGLAALATAAGIAPQVYAYPVESVTVPCVIIAYPTRMDFDVSFQRGGDELELPVFVLVGKTSTQDARDRLSTLLGDASSIKSAFDGAQSFGDVRVTNASIEEVTVAAVTYLAAKFTVEVI